MKLQKEDVWYSPWDMDLELGGELYEDAAEEERERQRREQETLLLGVPESEIET